MQLETTQMEKKSHGKQDPTRPRKRIRIMLFIAEALNAVETTALVLEESYRLINS